MLDNAPNQPPKYRTKSWVKINDYSRRMYTTNSQTKFKTMTLKTSLCDYSDACILVSGTTAITGAGPDDAAIAADRNNKQIKKLCTIY